MGNSKRIIALLIFCLSAPLLLKAGNIPGGTKNILYISSYSNTFPTFPQQVRGLESVFRKYDNINVDYEFMYSRNYANMPINIKLFSDLLEYKLRHAIYPVDLVMVAVMMPSILLSTDVTLCSKAFPLSFLESMI